MVDQPELLLLHALPLDGDMWAKQMHLLPDATHAPTLYGFGHTVTEWASEALKTVRGDRLIVIGCSVGGSCALEIAALAPERVAALVLIGTKCRHRPDPELRDRALDILRLEGPEMAWRQLWQPLLSPTATSMVQDEVRRLALRQSQDALTRGVRAFHSRQSRDDVVAALARPIIFVSGDRDTAPGQATTAAQAAMALYGHLRIVPDCGHYCPLEKPDAVNAIIDEAIGLAC